MHEITLSLTIHSTVCGKINNEKINNLHSNISTIKKMTKIKYACDSYDN